MTQCRLSILACVSGLVVCVLADRAGAQIIRQKYPGAASAPPALRPGENWLKAVCPDCKVDLQQPSPIHAIGCKWSAESNIDAQEAAVNQLFSAGQISRETQLASLEALHNAYRAAWYARMEAERRARAAKAETERLQRQADHDAAGLIHDKRKQLEDSRALDGSTAESLQMKAKALEQQAREARAAGNRSTANEVERMARAFKNAAERSAAAKAGFAGQDGGHQGQASDGASEDGETNSTPRDFEARPLVLGDSQEAHRYAADLHKKLVTPLMSPPSPGAGIQTLMSQGSSKGVHGLGNALNSVAGLSDVRDSVIDNVIGRIPGYFEEQFRRLDATSTKVGSPFGPTDAWTKTFPGSSSRVGDRAALWENDGGSPTAQAPTPGEIRNLLGLGTTEPKPDPAAARSWPTSPWRGVRELWTGLAAQTPDPGRRPQKEPEAAAAPAPNPRALRDLLHP